MRSRCFVVFFLMMFCFGGGTMFGCWKLDENSERELWADARSTISGDYSVNGL